MKTNMLRISKCHAPCAKCKIENDFLMFESGPGGDFETFIGDKSGNIYRMDMHKVHYLNIESEELLEPAIALEGGNDNLRNIPDAVKCKVCGSVSKAVPITFSGYIEVDAIEL